MFLEQLSYVSQKKKETLRWTLKADLYFRVKHMCMVRRSGRIALTMAEVDF